MKINNDTKYKYIGKFIKNLLKQIDLPKKFTVDISDYEKEQTWIAWEIDKSYTLNIALPEIFRKYKNKYYFQRYFNEVIKLPKLTIREFLTFCVLHEIGHYKTKQLFYSNALLSRKERIERDIKADVWALKWMKKNENKKRTNKRIAKI